MNSAAGSLSLSGVPVVYEPGKTYRVQLRLTHPGVVIGGFEMTARFEVGGAQAGQLAFLPEDGGLIAVGMSQQVQYVHHLRPGTTSVVQDTARWTVLWAAPSERGGGPVTMHAAGNAANDDDSPLGDYIYTVMASSQPASR